ncbi:MAG: hypothetical protein IMZ55_15885 [Acidobacteria bacterium]|nr:hypothetical protein [Acidobacteriota bacterium]
MRRLSLLLVALVVLGNGLVLTGQSAPLLAEKTVIYRTGDTIALDVKVGTVTVSGVKMTVGGTGGIGSAMKATLTRMDPLTQTVLQFDFDAESPKGWGKWQVTYSVELLDAKGEMIDRFSDKDSYEAEAKTSNFKYVTLKAVLPLIDKVRIKFQAAAD